MKPHSYDQALFPDLTPLPVRPRSQEEIDAQIAAIAASASLRTVEVIDVTSEAARDQGHLHETPRLGIRRPTAAEISESGGALSDDNTDRLAPSNDRFLLSDKEREKGLAGVAKIRRQIEQLHNDPNRPKFPRI